MSAPDESIDWDPTSELEHLTEDSFERDYWDRQVETLAGNLRSALEITGEQFTPKGAVYDDLITERQFLFLLMQDVDRRMGLSATNGSVTVRAQFNHEVSQAYRNGYFVQSVAQNIVNSRRKIHVTDGIDDATGLPAKKLLQAELYVTGREGVWLDFVDAHMPGDPLDMSDPEDHAIAELAMNEMIARTERARVLAGHFLEGIRRFTLLDSALEDRDRNQLALALAKLTCRQSDGVDISLFEEVRILLVPYGMGEFATGVVSLVKANPISKY